ncbi:MAG TPA: type II CAAX endopeptidase family protein [Solirubrobacterales bacterium]|jgi:membrane protease YdiL (CAAX protease family)|nr:type II CAAX endopeptidase family protein [Solirubrobacterales bacterium]
MEANLTAAGVERPRDRFPYANWGPLLALLGVPLALVTGIVLGIPGLLFGVESDGGLTTAGTIIGQFGAELGFLLVPGVIAAQRGAKTLRDVLARLGMRRFDLSALKWMVGGVAVYFAFAAFYALLITEPKQEDITKSLGPLPFQILLIVIAAPICEEVCFRGMLFGGLREKLPMVVAALASAAVFGALHAPEGITVVPPLIAFGLVLALLYEKTGSIVPGILLHVLNNSIALVALHGQ